MQLDTGWGLLHAFVVSTLTRPEGRMQLDELNVFRQTQNVSTLTRPEGRMQPGVPRRPKSL